MIYGLTKGTDFEKLCDGAAMGEQKENFCLLNLSVSYALTRHLVLWARGENLHAPVGMQIGVEQTVEQ